MFTRREKRSIGLMFLVNYCLIIDFMVMMPLGSALMTGLGISAKAYGMLVAGHTFVAGVTGLLAALFIDRFERRRLLLTMLAGLAASSVLAGFAETFPALVAVRCLSGALVGVIGSLSLSILSDEVALPRRGTALGIVMSSFAFAAISGVPAALYLANRFGWGAAFQFLGVVVAAVALGCRALERGVPKGAGGLAQVRRLIQDKNAALALVFLCVLILGHFSVIPFLFPSIIANARVAPGELPLIYLAGGVVSVFASVFFGLLSDRWGIKKAFTVGMIGSVPTLYFVTRLTPSPLPVVIFAVSCFYTFMGGRMTPAMTLVTSTVSERHRGSFLSLASAVNHLSAGVAAAVAGATVAKEADGTLANLPHVGLVAISFSLLALVLIAYVHPYRAREAAV